MAAIFIIIIIIIIIHHPSPIIHITTIPVTVTISFSGHQWGRHTSPEVDECWDGGRHGLLQRSLQDVVADNSTHTAATHVQTTGTHQAGFGKKTVPPLTPWGQVTHICISELTSIGSDNGLSPGRRQAIFWANAGILLIVPLGTNFS